MGIPRVHLEQSLAQAYDYLDSVGEYIEASVASGAAIAMTSGAVLNVTSITLTPGDWNLFGVVGHLPAASTSITHRTGGSSLVSATLGSLGSTFALSMAAVVPGAVSQIAPLTTFRVNVTVSTVVYLVTSANFTVAALSAFGLIAARRVSKP